MLIINENEATDLVSMVEAIEVMRDAFSAIASGHFRTYPVVREALPEVRGVFGVKAASREDLDLLGLKAGGYWQSNGTFGLTNHQSSTVLFNKATGNPAAFVSANHLTALRTAGVAGLASRVLARKDATTLGIIGSGGQALFQVEAIRAVRPIERVLVVSRSGEKAEALAAALRADGVSEASAVDAQTACRNADIITTVTPSCSPVLTAGWIRPGTHINAMGADTRGKQEIDPCLFAVASIFVDDWLQAASIGECQHIAASGRFNETQIAGTLGMLAAGSHPGRRSQDEITLFDSTGLAIQDLAIAQHVVKRAQARGSGTEIDLRNAC